MNEDEAKLLLKIGMLIRGDWTGTYFDGRDVLGWICRVVEGKTEGLEDELKRYEENY